MVNISCRFIVDYLHSALYLINMWNRPSWDATEGMYLINFIVAPRL
jgi:hypothetical protein